MTQTLLDARIKRLDQIEDVYKAAIKAAGEGVATPEIKAKVKAYQARVDRLEVCKAHFTPPAQVKEAAPADGAPETAAPAAGAPINPQ